jgi:hypothetical protein
MYDEEEATGDSGGASAPEDDSAPEAQADAAEAKAEYERVRSLDYEAETGPSTEDQAAGEAEAEARRAPDAEGDDASE